jgi:hypothetical protein
VKRLFLFLFLILNYFFLSGQKLDLIVTIYGDSIACRIDSFTVDKIYFEGRMNGTRVNTFIETQNVSKYRHLLIENKNIIRIPGSLYFRSRNPGMTLKTYSPKISNMGNDSTNRKSVSYSLVKKDSSNRKHSINIECGGRVVVFGLTSLNYEYKFNKTVCMGAGIALEWKELGFPYYVLFRAGRKEHHFVVSPGITYWPGTFSDFFAWNFCLGYEFENHSIYYRLIASTVKFDPYYDSFFKGLMPWAGLTFGKKF